MKDSMLAIGLDAVPLHIISLKANSGPTDKDMQEAMEFGRVLAAKGDMLLFKSKKEGETAAMFNKLARVIAVLAFIPGGITIFGSHWEVVNVNRARN